MAKFAFECVKVGQTTYTAKNDLRLKNKNNGLPVEDIERVRAFSIRFLIFVPDFMGCRILNVK
ncbi:MAG: hypothetical protein OHK0019_23680 [Saprospiraceae bacterium]